MEVGAATMENNMEVFKKPRIELPYDLAIPFLGIYLEKTNSIKYLHPDVHHSIICNSQDIEAT